MGRFDTLQVHPRHLPAWSSIIDRKTYHALVDDLTAGTAQMYLDIAMDSFRIAEDGRFLVTSANWQDYRGSINPAFLTILDAGIPEAGGAEVRWLRAFSDTLDPYPHRFQFDIVQGRLTAVRLSPTPSRKTGVPRIDRRHRAEQLRDHFGLHSRLGRKWAHAASRLMGIKKGAGGAGLGLASFDEYPFSDGFAEEFERAFLLMRHVTPKPVYVTQDLTQVDRVWKPRDKKMRIRSRVTLHGGQVTVGATGRPVPIDVLPGMP